MKLDVFEAIRSRWSVRRYIDRPVEEDLLAQVLDAGRLAPSAKNLQNWKFVVVRDKERRARLAKAAKDQAFVAEAPVVIAACGTQPEIVMTCGQPAYAIDVAIAVDHMTLAATALGLGTCWIGAFYEDRVKEILGVPEDVRVVAMLTLGHPNEAPRQRSRKGPEEIRADEVW